MLLLLGDISGKRFRLLLSTLPFCDLSDRLSVTFVHRAQTAEDIDKISFSYDSPLSFAVRVINHIFLAYFCCFHGEKRIYCTVYTKNCSYFMVTRTRTEPTLLRTAAIGIGYMVHANSFH